MAAPLYKSAGQHCRGPKFMNHGAGLPQTVAKGPGLQQDTHSRDVAVHFETRDGQAPPFTVADVTLKTGLVDYYEMLQLPKSANLPEIKAAYRRLQKLCHPDILGPEHGHDMSILLNDAYTVLSNESTRELYDIDLNESKMEEEMGFSNEPLSEWLPMTDPTNSRHTNPGETRAVFVDEVSCIGCKNCCFQAENSFILEAEYGRARVTKQWADTEENLDAAVESCPVRCIHWVEREELPVLEHVMASIPRVDVCNLQSSDRRGTGGNVFSLAEAFKKKKREGRVARKSWTEAFMYSRAQEAAMHRARSTEAEGSLGALQRAMTWARNGLWDLFGLGIARQGPEEGGPLATGKAQTWSGTSPGGQGRILGREPEPVTAAAAEMSAEAAAVTTAGVTQAGAADAAPAGADGVAAAAAHAEGRLDESGSEAGAVDAGAAGQSPGGGADKDRSVGGQ
eukprot:jgi/Ulvmu1/11619/UM008_0020.1